MTTIAYHHKDKQVAVDSRAVSGSIIRSDNCNKVIKRGKRIYFMIGEAPDHERFVNEAEQGKGTDELECSGLMIDNGKLFQVNQTEHRYVFDEIKESMATGSGGNFAMAAMDFGQTAKQAVQYAAKRDIYTGGRIRVFNV